MNITSTFNISAAVNQAKFISSNITQHQYTEQQTVSNSNKSAVNFIGSMTAVDNDYTKQDALLKQWNKEGSFNLYGVLSGKETVKLQNPNPSEDELSELEKILQQNGLSSDIDWSSFEFDLKGTDFNPDFEGQNLKAEDFSKNTDYFASRYASIKDKIFNSYSGDEQKKQLEKLDEIYNKALEQSASSYADIVGDFLTENGLIGEKDKIYQSFIDGVNQKAEEYLSFLQENKDFTGLKGTKDEWLLQDDEYIASMLRAENIDLQNKESKDNVYTLNDLDILGRYVSELSSWEGSDTTYNMSEECIGLDFAVLSMKTNELLNNSDVSSALSNTLQKMVNGFMNGYIERLDKELAQERQSGVAIGDKEGFASLDREAIWNVYNKTMEEYNSTGDIIKAITEGGKYAASQALNKVNSGTYRHKNNLDYWSNFFEKTIDKNLQSYDDSLTTMQKYVIGLEDFNQSLKSTDGIRLNMNIKLADMHLLLNNNVDIFA